MLTCSMPVTAVVALLPLPGRIAEQVEGIAALKADAAQAKEDLRKCRQCRRALQRLQHGIDPPPTGPYG
jgi:hypothetical protein